MTYIWRDSIDPEQFHLGVKNGKGYSMYATIFVDGVYELFELTLAQFKLITTNPIEIELKLDILKQEKENE